LLILNNNQNMEKKSIHNKSFAENAEPFVAGGLSAMLGSAVVFPADLVKVRQQVSVGKVKGPIRMGAEIVKNEGIPGLYKGLSASLLRQATYGTARIGLHRAFSDKLVEINGGAAIPFWQKASSGMVSGAMAVCVGSPMDVALVRCQTDSMLPVSQRRNYRNVFDALLKISREEGLTKLWRGLGPNVLRGMAMNAGSKFFFF
jgi:solute carrier family 25 oxoglutarate transporter 11